MAGWGQHGRTLLSALKAGCSCDLRNKISFPIVKSDLVSSSPKAQLEKVPKRWNLSKPQSGPGPESFPAPAPTPGGATVSLFQTQVCASPNSVNILVR